MYKKVRICDDDINVKIFKSQKQPPEVFYKKRCS